MCCQIMCCLVEPLPRAKPFTISSGRWCLSARKYVYIYTDATDFRIKAVSCEYGTGISDNVGQSRDENVMASKPSGDGSGTLELLQ